MPAPAAETAYPPAVSAISQRPDARLPLEPGALETQPLLVVLPSLNYIAALVLAELHGRMGHFPAVLRLRPVQGSSPTIYETAEILNLQTLRQSPLPLRSISKLFKIPEVLFPLQEPEGTLRFM